MHPPKKSLTMADKIKMAQFKYLVPGKSNLEVVE
jgi:hypothetical protein